MRVKTTSDLELRDLTIVAAAIFAPIMLTMMVIAPRFHYSQHADLAGACAASQSWLTKLFREKRLTADQSFRSASTFSRDLQRPFPIWNSKENKTVLPIIKHIETWSPDGTGDHVGGRWRILYLSALSMPSCC